MKITTDKVRSFIEDPLAAFRAVQVIIASICFLIPLILRTCDHDEYYPAKLMLADVSKIKSCDAKIKIDTIFETEKWPNKNPPDESYTLNVCASPIEIITVTKIYKSQGCFRSSISHYAHSSNSYIYGLLYCMTAMMFIFNGAVYIRNNKRFRKEENPLPINKWGPWFNIIIGLCLIGVVLNPIRDREYLHVIFTVLFFLGIIIVMCFFPNPLENKISKGVRYTLAALAIISLAIPFFSRLSILWGEWFALTFIAVYLFLIAKWAGKKNSLGENKYGVGKKK